MKKIKLILGIIGLSIGMAGCSEQKIEESVLRPDESQVEQAAMSVSDEIVSEVECEELLIESKDEETKQKLVEEVDNTTEASELEMVNFDVESEKNPYEEILDLYYQVLEEYQRTNKREFDTYYTEYGMIEAILNPYWAWEGAEDILSKEGYCLMDLDGDGVDELLLGWQDNELWNMNEGYVFAIYSMQDDKVVPAVEGWERCLYVIGEDGFLYQAGNSSAWEGSYKKYKFNLECDGFLELIEEIYSYMDTSGKVAWKHVPEFKTSEEAVNLEQKEALSIGDGWMNSGKKLDYISFAEYGQSKKGFELEFLQDNDRVDAGEHYVAMVTPEGKVKVAYRDGWADEEVLSTEWEAVVRLANTDSFPVGITREGNLFIPQGRTLKDYESDMEEFEKSEANGGMYLGMKIANAKAMSEWNGLQQIYGEHSEYGALGLFSDGTVKEAGLIGIGMAARSLEELQTLKGIKEMDLIYNGQYVVALLDNGEVKHISDGKIETLRMDGVLWDNMVAVESGKVMFYGLTNEGKVLHTSGPLGKTNITKAMKDIVFIAVGYDEINNSDVVYGINKDGIVVDYEGNVVPGLEDVVEIAVMDFTPNVVIGMKEDGTICVSDNADENMKESITKWNEK